jgi:hypothetical protein
LGTVARHAAVSSAAPLELGERPVAEDGAGWGEPLAEHCDGPRAHRRRMAGQEEVAEIVERDLGARGAAVEARRNLLAEPAASVGLGAEAGWCSRWPFSRQRIP